MISDRKLRTVLRSDAIVATAGDLLRAVICAAALAVIARYLLSFATSARTMFGEWHMSDFGKFYYAARAFLDGQPMYGPTPATATVLRPGLTIQLWDMNPPHFHLLILPLARLDPLPAILTWTALNAGALAVAIHL